MIDNYITELTRLFSENANVSIAEKQAAYMKHHFDFYGIKTPLRRTLQKPFLDKKNLPSKNEAVQIVSKLWKYKERELHYFAMELLYIYKNQWDKEDIVWIEKLILNNSWWDSVDFLAPKIAGTYFEKFPEQKETIIHQWKSSDNLWLNRSAVIFQLKYKENTDVQLLSEVILHLHSHPDFFVRKAIGWALREYAKTNSEWVKNFVQKHQKNLSNLSVREALKNL